MLACWLLMWRCKHFIPQHLCRGSMAAAIKLQHHAALSGLQGRHAESRGVQAIQVGSACHTVKRGPPQVLCAGSEHVDYL